MGELKCQRCGLGYSRVTKDGRCHACGTPIQAVADPVAWQKRLRRKEGEWTGWYECTRDDFVDNSPSRSLKHFEIEYRALYDRPDHRVRELVEAAKESLDWILGATSRRAADYEIDDPPIQQLRAALAAFQQGEESQ